MSCDYCGADCSSAKARFGRFLLEAEIGQRLSALRALEQPPGLVGQGGPSWWERRANGPAPAADPVIGRTGAPRIACVGGFHTRFWSAYTAPVSGCPNCYEC